MSQDLAPSPLVCTRVITGQEVVTGEVAMHPDLESLEIVAATMFPLASGGQVAVDHDRPGDSCVLVGAPGWLGGAVAGGDLLAFRWDGEALAVGPLDGEVDEPASGRMIEALLAAAAASDPGPGGAPVFLARALKAAVDADADALARPLRPLSDLLGQAGLEYHHGWVGRPGTDWSALDAEQRRQNDLAMLAAGYRLTKAGYEALQALLAAVPLSAAGQPLPEELVSALTADDGVAPAFVSAALGAAPLGLAAGVEGVESLARRALPEARGRQRAPVLWLLASCAEHRDDWSTHDRMVGEAVAADPRYGPALQDASWTASDRGQAGRAASLLGTGGLPADDPWRKRLEHFAHPGPNQSGRNDPCKCGSGRKAKACCGAANGWPIESRLPWVYDKAVSFLSRPAQREVLTEVLDAWVEAAGADPASTRRRLLDDPFPEDLALFEGGVLPRFVEARGPLLPADEAAVAASWVDQPLRLCEVVAVTPDEGLVLEDLLTGERLEIADRVASRSVVRHLLVCARPLPDGRGGLHLLGGVRVVPFGRHDGLLDMLRPDGPPGPRSGPGSALALAAWWAVATGPARLADPDSEPSVLGRSVLALPPGTTEEQARKRLLGALEASGDDDLVLVQRDGDGLGDILGWARILDGRVVLEANSAERLDALTNAVNGAVAGLALLDSVIVALGPVLVERWLSATSRATLVGVEPPDPSSAEDEAGSLAERLRAYEERWVDEEIPALDGATPRQAAADPARARDLERLLAEMTLVGGGMDAGRVRALLGLTAVPSGPRR